MSSDHTLACNFPLLIFILYLEQLLSSDQPFACNYPHLIFILYLEQLLSGDQPLACKYPLLLFLLYLEQLLSSDHSFACNYPFPTTFDPLYVNNRWFWGVTSKSHNFLKVAWIIIEKEPHLRMLYICKSNKISKKGVLII